MNAPSPFVAQLPLPVYADVSLWTTGMGVPTPWEFSGWMPESLSWKKGTYIHSGLSGPNLRLTGPNAIKLLKAVSVNSFENFKPGTEKHAIMLTDEGTVGCHGLLQRSGDEEFTLYAAGVWPLFQAARLGIEVEAVPLPLYIFQVSGPTSLQTLERATGENLRDIKFMHYRASEIDGIRVEISRIGMSGTLAYEVRGPLEEGPAVYDAIYKAGADYGIERLGWLTYLENHVEGGFPQGGWTFKFAQPLDGSFAEYLKQFGMDWVLNVKPAGSLDPADMRSRERTPYDLGWGQFVKFDHDFVGREAAERDAANHTRTIVTLKWNPDDVVDIYASLLRPGDNYKQLTLPVTSGGLIAHADRVTVDGELVGIASAPVYSYYYREVISHATIDIATAEAGGEVIVEWGDFGGPIKKVRATIERYPYLDLPRNQNYDLSSIPSGVAELATA